jgi:hypothetical protein
MRSNTKDYGGKTYYTDSQNSDETAPSGRELYHFQFSLQADSPETFGFTFILSYTVKTVIGLSKFLSSTAIVHYLS